ncbi:hypothetical protein ACLBOM_08830 [Escherichia coli]
MRCLLTATRLHFSTVLLVLSMIVYGCAFDFFNISGSVFVEKEVSPAIRACARDVPDDDQRLTAVSSVAS